MEEEYTHVEHVFMREDEARDFAEYEAELRRTRAVALPIWDHRGAWCVMVYSKKQKPECIILLSENHD